MYSTALEAGTCRALAGALSNAHKGMPGAAAREFCRYGWRRGLAALACLRAGWTCHAGMRSDIMPILQTLVPNAMCPH